MSDTVAQDVVASNDACVLCPECGYDLRGTSVDRCSECGFVLDRASLLQSGFPWAHRAKIGRVRAYLRTVSAVSLGSQSLRHETSRPQQFHDARMFARVTAMLLAFAAAAIFVLFLLDRHWSLEFLNYFEETRTFTTLQGARNSNWDLVAPWSAGATIWAVALAAITLLSIYIVGAPRTAFTARLPSDVDRTRAAAIAYYAIAPLAICLVGGLLAALACLTRRPPISTVITTNAVAFGLNAGACVVVVVAILITLVRLRQWVARVRRTTAVDSVLHVAHVVLLWLFGAVVLLGLFPWCAGLIAIAIESMR